ncbi:hypothetical protein Syun_023438 [Stephania yunnanensis]|uniref:Uncharacterized protein n=1 Tax=Stephania yunnanensis TaxID=152371 RepID=A0AAP0I293_9MAGN
MGTNEFSLPINILIASKLTPIRYEKPQLFNHFLNPVHIAITKKNQNSIIR